MAKRSWLAGRAIAMVEYYRKAISSRLGANCRYTPTCSQYALDAFNYYGFWLGGLKTFWRILRCNPLSKGGYDPAVPCCVHADEEFEREEKP